MLSISGVTKRYGKTLANDNISFAVGDGQIGILLGPNGAGKSTTLKMILGLVRPTQGEIQVFGQPMNRSNRIAVLRQVGSLIESPSYYGHLTGEENLRIVQTLRGLPPKAIREVLEIVRLEGQRGKKVCHYSLGMKQRLGIATALLGYPKLLILDEPTNGLDIEATVEMREVILRLAKEKGVTFLVASHLAAEIEKMCDKVLVLYEGEMLSFDTKEEALRLNPSLEDYFLAKVRDKKGSVVL